MHVLDIAAAVLLAILGRGLFVLVKPYRECWWCKGTGRARWRPGLCFRCHGHKLTRRLGAYHVHKVKQSLIQAWDEREWWR
jgi:hypothetical protein